MSAPAWAGSELSLATITKSFTAGREDGMGPKRQSRKIRVPTHYLARRAALRAKRRGKPPPSSLLTPVDLTVAKVLANRMKKRQRERLAGSSAKVIKVLTGFWEGLLDHIQAVPNDLPSEFKELLEAWESRHGKSVVHDALCLLGAANLRRGLNDEECAALLHIDADEWDQLAEDLGEWLREVLPEPVDDSGNSYVDPVQAAFSGGISEEERKRRAVVRIGSKKSSRVAKWMGRRTSGAVGGSADAVDFGLEQAAKLAESTAPARGSSRPSKSMKSATDIREHSSGDESDDFDGDATLLSDADIESAGDSDSTEFSDVEEHDLPRWRFDPTPLFADASTLIGGMGAQKRANSFLNAVQASSGGTSPVRAKSALHKGTQNQTEELGVEEKQIAIDEVTHRLCGVAWERARSDLKAYYYTNLAMFFFGRCTGQTARRAALRIEMGAAVQTDPSKVAGTVNVLEGRAAGSRSPASERGTTVAKTIARTNTATSLLKSLAKSSCSASASKAYATDSGGPSSAAGGAGQPASAAATGPEQEATESDAESTFSAGVAGTVNLDDSLRSDTASPPKKRVMPKRAMPTMADALGTNKKSGRPKVRGGASLWKSLKKAVRQGVGLRQMHKRRMRQSSALLAALLKDSVDDEAMRRAKRRAHEKLNPYMVGQKPTSTGRAKTKSGKATEMAFHDRPIVEKGVRIGRWHIATLSHVHALRELAYWIVVAERKREACRVVTDLHFLEAMAACGYTVFMEFIDSVHLLHQLLKKALEEAEADTRKLAAGQSTGKQGDALGAMLRLVLTAGGQSGTAAGDDMMSAALRLRQIKVQAKAVSSILSFIRRDVVTTTRFPFSIFQQAYNMPNDTFVFSAANRRWESGLEQRQFLRWTNKPTYTSPLQLVLGGTGDPYVHAVAASTDGDHVASAHEDGSIIIWHSGTGRRICVLRRKQHNVIPQPSPKAGTPKASEKPANSPKVGIAARLLKGKVKPAVAARATSVAFVPGKRRYLVVGDFAGSLWLWDVMNEDCKHIPRGAAPPLEREQQALESASRASSTETAATAPKKQEVGEGSAHSAAITRLSWHASGRFLLTGDAVGVVALWEFAVPAVWHVYGEVQPVCSLRWHAHPTKITHLSFASDAWTPELEVADPLMLAAVVDPDAVPDHVDEASEGYATDGRLSSSLPHPFLRSAGASSRVSLGVGQTLTKSASAATVGAVAAAATGSKIWATATASSVMSHHARALFSVRPSSAVCRDPVELPPSEPDLRRPTSAAARVRTRKPLRHQQRIEKRVKSREEHKLARQARSERPLITMSNWASLDDAVIEAEQKRLKQLQAKTDGVGRGRLRRAIEDAIARSDEAEAIKRAKEKKLKESQRRKRRPKTSDARLGSPHPRGPRSIPTSPMRTRRGEEPPGALPQSVALRSRSVAAAEAASLHEGTKTVELGLKTTSVESVPIDDAPSPSPREDDRDGPAQRGGGAVDKFGLLFANTGSSASLVVWRVSALSRTAAKVGHTVGDVLAARNTPDGVMVLVRRSNAVPYIVADDGTRVPLQEPQGGDIMDAAFSSRERVACVTRDSHQVNIYRVSDGKKVGCMRGHTTRINTCVWHPEGRLVVTGGHDGTVRVWRPDILPEGVPPAEHKGIVVRACFSTVEEDARGGKAISVASDGVVKFWRVSQGRPFAVEAAKMVFDRSVLGARFTAAGDSAIVVTPAAVRLWPPIVDAPGRLTHRDICQNGSIRLWDISPLADVVAYTDTDGLEGVIIIHVSNNRVFGKFAKVEARHFQLMSFSPDGRVLVTASDDGGIRVWDHTQCSRGTLLKARAEARTPKEVAHVEATTGENLQPLAVLNDGGVTSVLQQRFKKMVWAPNGRHMIMVTEYHQLVVWDVPMAIEHAGGLRRDKLPVVCDGLKGAIRRFDGHDGKILDACWSPGMREIATCGTDKSLRIWDFTRQAPRNILLGHSGEACESVHWSKTAERLISTGGDQTVRVWNPFTCEPLAVFKATQSISCVAVNPTATRIAVGDRVGGVRLLELEGTRVQRQRGQSNHYQVHDIPCITARRTFLTARHAWSTQLQCRCTFCSHCWQAPKKTLAAIDRIARQIHSFGPLKHFYHDVSLLVRCTSCRRSHRVNPFVSDNALQIGSVKSHV